MSEQRRDYILLLHTSQYYISHITDHASPNRMKTHKDLDVRKEAMTLVKGIYKLTADFPKEEKCCSG